VENHQFDVILSYFEQNLESRMFNITYLQPLAQSSKICRFFFEFFYHHDLLGYVEQYLFKMFMNFFSSQDSKLVYNYESLSLNIRQGSGDVHFTALAPKVTSTLLPLFLKIK